MKPIFKLRQILSREAMNWCFDGLSRAADLVVPPTCLSCDAAIGRAGLLCADCWASARFIEKPYCEVLGSPFSYDLGEGALSASAIANPPVFDRARAAVLYDKVAKKLVHGLKFNDRTDLAPWMASWMCRAGHELFDERTVIVPVPLHRRRLISRKFNQSAELARHIARQCELQYFACALHRTRPTAQQVGLGAAERQRNVRGAFRVPADQEINIHSKHVVLVDDVLTTGATLQACARALRRNGVAKIDCLTFARVANGVAPTDL